MRLTRLARGGLAWADNISRSFDDLQAQGPPPVVQLLLLASISIASTSRDKQASPGLDNCTAEHLVLQP